MSKVFVAAPTQRHNTWRVVRCLKPEFDIPHLSRITSEGYAKGVTAKARDVIGWQISSGGRLWVRLGGELGRLMEQEFGNNTACFEQTPNKVNAPGLESNIEAWNQIWEPVESIAVEPQRIEPKGEEESIDAETFIAAHPGKLRSTSRMDTVMRLFEELHGTGWRLQFRRGVSNA